MRIELIGQEQFVVNSMVKLLSDPTGKRPEDTYVSAVGNAIDELVRQSLRRLSEERRGFSRWEDLLDAAVDESHRAILQGVNASGLSFDSSHYLSHARKLLEAAAKDLFSLSRKLIESKERRRIADKTKALIDLARLSYEVSEMGLLGSVEALLARPTSDVKVLDIERVRGSFLTQGEWFPFEVSVGDLLLVIDDDGSIFVSTENFPEEMMERARMNLHQVAQTLYA